jgi:hypothetical protein
MNHQRLSGVIGLALLQRQTGKRWPTTGEIAKMTTKELYDLFGTRYPSDST